MLAMPVGNRARFFLGIDVILTLLADVSRCVMTAAKILHLVHLHLLTRVPAVEESECLYWTVTKLHLTFDLLKRGWIFEDLHPLI